MKRIPRALLLVFCAACVTPAGNGALRSPEEISDAEVFRVLVSQYAARAGIPLLIDARPMARQPVTVQPDRVRFEDRPAVAAARRSAIASMSGASEAPLTAEKSCPNGAAPCPEYAHLAFSLPWRGTLSEYVPGHRRRLRPTVGEEPWVVRVYFLDYLESGRTSAGVVDWFIARIDGELVILEKLGLAWLH